MKDKLPYIPIAEEALESAKTIRTNPLGSHRAYFVRESEPKHLSPLFSSLYIIAAHPHEDHIGGMAEVLHNYVPDLLIMPYVSYETAAFERLDKAIESLQIDTGEPRPRDTYEYGESTRTIIHPRMNQKYEEINDYSVGVRWDFGQSSMIACGDATEIAESDMLLSPRQLQADIYRVNHHGSDTSSSMLFLAAMSPSYAVISCGEAPMTMGTRTKPS